MKVRALKAFVGAGIVARKGDIVDIPDHWVEQYVKRGLVSKQDATYQTKVVTPRRSGGLTENHPYIDDPVQTESSLKRDDVTLDELEQRGPYYVLPDGERVLGRAAAEEELAKYNATKYESDN